MKTRLLFITISFSSLISFAQNIGINTSNPHSSLDLHGDLATNSYAITIDTISYDVDLNDNRAYTYLLKGATANFVIAGIKASNDGRMVNLINLTGHSLEIYNDEPLAVDSFRILTSTGTTLAIYNNGNVLLRYVDTLNRWMVLAAHHYNLNFYGVTQGWNLNGNSSLPAGSFIGTLDAEPLRFKMNNVPSGLIDSAKANTILGYGAFQNNNNILGDSNVVLGTNAVKTNSYYARNNVVIGARAMEENAISEGNIAIGYKAMQKFTGLNSPSGTIGSNHHTAIGYKALTNTSGSSVSNTAVGGHALSFYINGGGNTAVGDFALWKNINGNSNVGLGAEALFNNTASNNVAIGRSASYNNTVGISNTAIGDYALFTNTSGNENVAIGYNSGYNNKGNYSVSVGFESLSQNNFNNNTAIGHKALRNAGSENNTAVGSAALFGGGYRSTAIGSFALYNGGGYDNIAIGMNSLSNGSGYGNTICGTFAFPNNSNGNQNSAFGYFSLGNSNGGSNNIAVGYKSLYNLNGGNFNIGIGYEVNLTNTTGSWNTVIGEHANTNANNLDGVTAIGASAIATASNKIYLGANVAGMEVQAYGPYTNLSDGRFKENINDNIPGLSFITRLRPVSYTFNVDKLQKHITSKMHDSIAEHYYPDIVEIEKAKLEIRTGFIAQEVDSLVKSLNFEFDGVGKPQNDTDIYRISSSQFVVPLVKAVQEQQAEIEILKSLLIEIKKEITTMKSTLVK